ncbi:MAG TPA: sigma 54-interacting transcriptional regulator [Polyangia bacterium]
MKAQTTIVGDEQGPKGADALGAFLLVVGRDSYSTYNLPQNGTLTIGRGDSNEVRIDDPLASRNHARLYVDLGAGMYLEDLGSVNGTRIKDQPVQRNERVPVSAGDTIMIGTSVLIIQHRSRVRAPLVRPETLRDDALLIASGGPDVAMQRIYLLAERAAAGPINVLITGETGVGKELLAETVHRLSPRKNGPYVCLNCAALAESLLENELFGHERGAFTGASQVKQGLLETAAGGTLFLDEVGELPLTTQAKLLRVLETREVSRLGSLKPRHIDVRFIAATNRDLEAEVARGTFRRDLYFRLNGITLTIPPLRERVSEIRRLAETFVRQICQEMGRVEPAISSASIALLEGYAWPGNIRELKNFMERAVLLCTSRVILPVHLPADKMRENSISSASVVVSAASPVAAVGNVVASQPEAPTAVGETARLLSTAQEDERQRIMDALGACAGNQSRAAKLLNIPRRTFVAKLDLYRIPRPKKDLPDD